MSDNTPLLTVGTLLEELKVVADWRLLGAYLNVPKHVLDKINTEQSSVEHCKLEMLQYWIDTTTTASWNDIVKALEQINQLKMAAELKLKYLKTPQDTTPDGSSSSTKSDPSAVKTIKKNKDEKEEFPIMKGVCKGKEAFILTCIVLIIAIAVHDYCSYVEQQEKLQAANKLLAKQKSKLEKNARDLEVFQSHFPSSLVEVTAGVEEFTTVGKKTSFELSISSEFTSSIDFPIYHLNLQLTDPYHQPIQQRHFKKGSYSRQSDVYNFSYTPTQPGPHKLKITIRNSEIPGSPFTVRVLPSPEKRGMVQYTIITGINKPWGVAVSKSGEVLVTEQSNYVSVYSRVGKKIGSLGSKRSSTGRFQFPRKVAITLDKRILIADTSNHRIQIFTMEGIFVKSVGKEGYGPLQFQYPSGIAVHPSGRVFVADSFNHRIQVLNSNLSFSHTFGSKGSAPGQFSGPRDVAISSSGVVYVTDYNNNRVQLFSADGQLFNSSLGSKGSQHGQLYKPNGVSIDSTNTVYVTDQSHRVLVYNSSGQFVKSFGRQGSGEGELNFPKGIAVDDTTGALYVCDQDNDRVVVY